MLPLPFCLGLCQASDADAETWVLQLSASGYLAKFIGNVLLLVYTFSRSASVKGQAWKTQGRLSKAVSLQDRDCWRRENSWCWSADFGIFDVEGLLMSVCPRKMCCRIQRTPSLSALGIFSASISGMVHIRSSKLRSLLRNMEDVACMHSWAPRITLKDQLPGHRWGGVCRISIRQIVSFRRHFRALLQKESLRSIRKERLQRSCEDQASYL